jgi:tetratricopeptide (TPR) repeat protein
MSGYEDLNRGIEGLRELGFDDERAHEAMRAAIGSGDLDDDSLGLAHSMLGSAFHGTGRQEEARKELEQAVKLLSHPTLLANAHHELGETLFVLNEEPEAEKHYRKALEADREHTFAPDTLMLLGRAVYMRSDGDLELLEESYRYYDESLALLESAQSDNYGTFNARPKALFDAVFGKAICKSEMPGQNQQFEAIELFKEAERLALEHPGDITTHTELRNTYLSWGSLLHRMGLDREVQLVGERFERNVGR